MGESSLLAGSGPRSAEELLLGGLHSLIPRHADELARPVRVVVPSDSLRRHLSATLVRHAGRAVAGVVVQTHYRLAAEVLERAGGRAPAGALAQQLLVRRFAAGEPELAAAFAEQEDGYAVVAETVRDLLDAGFTAGHLEAAEEAVGAAHAGAGTAGVQRACAALRVAARCHQLADSLGLAHRGTVLATAARLLRERGEELVPAGAILIHGYAEATGLVSDLLEALADVTGARLIVDLPRDPADPARRDAGCEFAQRLLERLGHDVSATVPTVAPTAVVEAFTAPGPEAEAREIARRVRLLLDDGAAPERIAVVARYLDLETTLGLARHFRRLGVPFSGESVPSAAGPTQRRAAALSELLAAGPRASTESWLGAAGTIGGSSDTGVGAQHLRRLEVALRAFGATRLGAVAELAARLPAGTGVVALPLVEQLEVDGDREVRHRATLELRRLAAAAGEARTLAGHLQAWPERGTIEAHLRWAGGVLDLLGWDGSTLGGREIRGVLARLAEELPGDIELSRSELLPVLRRELRMRTAAPLGGAGGGVQLLTVMEARARTFDHLFLVNLGRGVFPRQVVEDPVLPDPLRRALLPVLPEMPVKERGRLEERYLFAQLMAAAGRVTLSWRTVDAEGRPANPSAFVERLRLAGVLPRAPGAVPAVPDVDSPARLADEDELRTPDEHAVLAGLVGRGRRYWEVLAEAAGSEDRARQMAALLDELDPLRPGEGLSPCLGLAALQLSRELWVTRMEALARCPWQWLLERVLGLEEPPETSLARTSLGGSLLGRVVHRVLEWAATDAGVPGGRTLAELSALEPRRPPWPDPATLRTWILEVATVESREAGVPILAPALARRAHVYLERARALDWDEGPPPVLGTEVEGAWEADLGDQLLTIRFRADRVDREDNILRLTDYKTSEPASIGAEMAVRRGELLQGAVYALAAGDGGKGRYLVLRDPEQLRKQPEVVVGRSEAEAAKAAVRDIVEGMRTGIAFPRMSDPGTDGASEAQACRSCRVREACHQGDPGVRQRLAAALDRLGVEHPLYGMWRLGKADVQGETDR